MKKSKVESTEQIQLNLQLNQLSSEISGNRSMILMFGGLAFVAILGLAFIVGSQADRIAELESDSMKTDALINSQEGDIAALKQNQQSFVEVVQDFSKAILYLAEQQMNSTVRLNALEKP